MIATLPWPYNSPSAAEDAAAAAAAIAAAAIAALGRGTRLGKKWE